MKPIYRPKGRAGEYSNCAINIYTGCNHGCVYCYAAKNAKRFGKDFTIVEPRSGIVEATVKQLKSFENEIIHLCFTCDPYPADIDTTTTREIIKAIKDSGNHVQILTKGGSRAIRDFDLLDSNDWFGVTFTGGQQFEPNADRDQNRQYSLAVAANRGIKTWVSFEPVLRPISIYSLLPMLGYVDLIKIGKLNHYKPEDLGYPAINWKEFGHEAERICKLHGLNYELKEDLRAEIED